MIDGFDETSLVIDDQDRTPPADGLSRLRFEEEAVQVQSARGDVAGSPTWPLTPDSSDSAHEPPPVGMNWQHVSERIGVNAAILEHDGSIVLAGEYVPAPGFALDPYTFLARPARVGDRVLYHSYFIGELTASEFGLSLAVDPESGSVPNAVVRTASAPVIGLFAHADDAERARRQIMEGSIGFDLSVESGPLGIEFRVARAPNAGRVATVIACHHGAVISIGGETLSFSK